MTAHLIQNQDNIKRGEDDKFSLASPFTSMLNMFNNIVSISISAVSSSFV
jgi:hypothetical protein